MRRSGRTTRLVDQAVQILFTEGEIFIPMGSWIERMAENMVTLSKEEFVKSCRFIDWVGESTSSMTQLHLAKTIQRRLDLEHQYQYEATKSLKGIWIKLKTESQDD